MLTNIIKGVLVAIIAYGLGSISFAYIITKIKIGKDIRTLGSGNAGFSNSMRVLSLPWALVIFALDVLKGYLAGFIGLLIFGATGGVIGLCLVIVGHTCPFWLQFRGGKGIAAGFGALLAIAPVMALIMLAIWAIVVLISNYISLGSVVAAISMPILSVLFNQPRIYIVFFIIVCVFVIYKHSGNLNRIFKHTEAKLFKNR